MRLSSRKWLFFEFCSCSGLSSFTRLAQDLDDPFFRDADFGPEFEKTAPKADSAETSGKKKKKKGKLTKQEEEDEKKQLAELELLLAGMSSVGPWSTTLVSYL